MTTNMTINKMTSDKMTTNKMTMNNVLIPIDGSPFSLQILRYVTRFLSPATNQLLLVYVAKEPEVVKIEQPGSEDLNIYVNEAEYAIRGNFADEMLPYRRELEKTGFTVTTEVCFGDPMPRSRPVLPKRPLIWSR